MRFYAVTKTDGKQKPLMCGANDFLEIEFNTGKKYNVDYKLRFEAVDKENYKLTFFDGKEKKVLVDKINRFSQVQCKHELDRYNRCIVCGKYIVN